MERELVVPWSSARIKAMPASCDSGLRGWQRAGAAILEPFVQTLEVCRSQPQPELGAPPENVCRGARPLFATQILGLAFVQLRQQLLAEVRERAGIAEHPIDPSAVRACVATAQAHREPWITPLDPAQERREAPAR